MSAKRRKKRKYHSKTKASKNLFARRGLLLLFLVLAIAAALFGMVQLFSFTGSLFFSRNPHFELKKIELSSDGRLSSIQLREYADVKPGVNLFAVDFDTVRENLSAVPLIESIRIQRKLPDTLVIRAVERVAVAQIRWARRGLPFLLDRYGIVLPATRSGRALPQIEGIKLDKLRPGERMDDSGVQYVLELLSTADALGLGSQIRFAGFDLRYPEFVTASLTGEVTARFPRHSAREKLIRLVRVLQIAREQGRRVKTMDLTPDSRNVPTTYH